MSDKEKIEKLTWALMFYAKYGNEWFAADMEGLDNYSADMGTRARSVLNDTGYPPVATKEK